MMHRDAVRSFMQGPFLLFATLALLMKLVDVVADPMFDSTATALVPSFVSDYRDSGGERRRWSSARLSPDTMRAENRFGSQSKTVRVAQESVSTTGLPATTLKEPGSPAQFSREEMPVVQPSATGASLRAAQHEISVSALEMRSLGPDLALKASSGRLLGLSQAASGYILALGFGKNALVSSDADLGGYFYEHESGMEEINIVSGSFPRAVASDDLACFSMPAKLDCLVLNHDARREQREWFDMPPNLRGAKPTSTIWSPVVPPQVPVTTRTCPWTWEGDSLGQICVGEAASAWKMATAVIATANTGVRYVTTKYAKRSGSNYQWMCTSGCDRDFGTALSWEKSNMTSSDPTFGKALAMHGNVIAVGTPGEADQEGRVEVFFARAAPGASGYDAHTSWDKVAHLPPPTPIGTTYVEYMGVGDFGAAVSVSSKWVVIGAPGNSSVAALVRIYKIGPTSISHFCEVKHPNAAANSLFGSSIAQDTHEAYGWTVVAVGAPGENLAYSILVRDDPPMCRMHEVFVPQESDKDPTDGFGFSVALASQYSFIGTPFYHRWYKDNSGLLYASAFCFPGSTRPAVLGNLRDMPRCTLCAKDQTSDGGSDDTCEACTVEIPVHASVNYGCAFTCDLGYFGSACLTCPEYATGQGLSKPDNSEWPSGRAGLTWVDSGTVQPTEGRRLENVKLSLALAEDGGNQVQFRGYEWEEFGIGDLRGDDFILSRGKFWKPAPLSCEARCIGGFYAAAGGNANLTCAQCPSQSAFNALFNVEWILGSCQYECEFGYFESSSDNLCYECREVKEKQGIAPPANAEFVNGLPVCEWAPLVGFNCTADPISNPDGLCEPCQNKPPQADFVDSKDQLSREKCDFVCKPNFYGHPKFHGLCVNCGVLQELYEKVDLPSNAEWVANPPECNDEAWVCLSGFTRSNSSRYCCPDVIENSHPDPSYQPCGRACDPGYQWNMETATCDTCPSPKQNHNWLLDCDYECKCSVFGAGQCYYGRNNPDLDNCYTCSEYHQELATPLPSNGIWYDDPPNSTGRRIECDADAYYCPEPGFAKSQIAVPPGCCPSNLPLSLATKVHDITDAAGRAKDTCGYECAASFMWQKVQKNCTFIASTKITNSKWNYRLGIWECLPSFKALGLVAVSHSAAFQPSQCIECSVYAIRAGWRLPTRGRWLNASEMNGDECDEKAFDCSDGFVQNPDAKLCCAPDALPVSVIGGTHENGVWDPLSCIYRCGSNRAGQKLFPVIPTRDNDVCMTCGAYLSAKGVASECQAEEGDTDKWCEGIQADDSPSSCTASLKLKLFIQGIKLENFTAGPAQGVLLTALANLAEHPREMTMVSYVQKDVSEDQLGNIGARRQLLAMGLLVGVLLRNMDPLVTIDRKQALQTSSQTRVADALDRAGYDVTLRLVSIQDGPSAEAFSCASGFTINPATGRCCFTKAYQDPSDIDPSRYYWLENGCEWKCVAAFKGPDCLSCSEYNRDKFKPENSVWDDNSIDCNSWKCRTGYVQSKSGYACNSLKQLEAICSTSTRCATCVAQSSCVWCGNRCVPGQVDGDMENSNGGCPFINEVVSPDCTCEANTCSQECLYDSCSECVKDAYCGWCASSEKCMLGSYFSPQSGVCTSGWSAGTYTQCYAEQGIWMVGLISASVSTLLVLMMCMHFILRLRAAQHMQRPPIVQFGAAPAGASSADQAREIMARFLETFPTFKYDSTKGKAGQDASDGQGPSNEDAEGTQPGGNDGDEVDPGDDEPVCSICLGNFVDGEECRMLPCLHVFHKACIDHWFSVSQECPLCKRSVMRMSTGQANSNFAAEQSRFGAPAGSESVDIAV